MSPGMDRIETFLNRITLRHLKLLDAVGTELNLSRAATRLSTSQPAVSQALREMEDLLEARLFDRSTRRIALTPQGALLWQHARRVLQDLEHAAHEFEAARSGVQAELTVALIGQIPASLVARAVARLAPEHRLRLSIREGTAADIVQSLAAGHIDLAISHMAAGIVTTPLEIEILYEDNTCLVAGRNHELFQANALTWEDVRCQRWILPHADVPMRARVEREMLFRGVPDLSNVLEASSPQVVLALLDAVDAIAVMNRQVAQPYASMGVLGILPIDFRLGRVRFALMRRQDRQPEALLQALWHAFKDESATMTA